MRRHLLVHVEPIEIELEDDSSLLFANLQSAYPGCSGLYYQSEQSKAKSSVKFDGQKFHAPRGSDWQDRDFYVTLGGNRCHFPFGSYENASKQFEKSVNLVSKLMGGKRQITYGEELMNGRRSPVEKIDSLKQIIQEIGASKVTVQKQEVSLSKAEALQRTAAALEANDANLSPLEQQFVDLARISTAKDSIIETQRADIRKLQDEMQALKKWVDLLARDTM